MKKKFLLFGGIGIFVLLLSAFATFMLLGHSASKAQANTPKTVVAASPTFTVGPTYTMQSRVVNLNGSIGDIHYLKITVVLAFSPTLDKDGEIKSKVPPKEVVLQDILTTTLSDKTVDDLANTHGKDLLKKSLIQQFSAVLSDLHLVNMYFPDFVMQ